MEKLDWKDVANDRYFLLESQADDEIAGECKHAT